MIHQTKLGKLSKEKRVGVGGALGILGIPSLLRRSEHICLPVEVNPSRKSHQLKRIDS